jgi:ligand-binding sensor domain-containing protein/DNA-binding CsgD family transcriptional regulator
MNVPHSGEKMKIFGLFLFFCLLLAFHSLSGQTNGINFTKDQYKAGSQNWGIEQDKEGNIFFANNEGLMVFNGAKWQVHPIPNNTIVRSVAFGPDNRLYVGGQDEIGYFEADVSGKLVFISLLELIDPVDRQFADIWSIVPFGDAIFFRSFSRVFRYHKGSMNTYQTSSKWEFLGKDGNKLIAHDKDLGLLSFKNNRWEIFVPSGTLPPEPGFTAMVSYQGESLLTTLNSGLFKLSGNRLTAFKLTGVKGLNELEFTTVLALDRGELLLGTYDDGILHVDSVGNVLEIITKRNGLGHNNVKCIFRDDQRKIWVGLEDGISFFDLNSPVKWLNPPIFNGAPGYAVSALGDKLYFALANGIYVMPFEKSGDYRQRINDIKKIAGGLSWNVENINGTLFAGRDDGFFQLSGTSLLPVDKTIGYWIFKSLTADNGNERIAAGNYLGVSFFRKQNGGFIKENDEKNLNTSARFLAYDSVLQAIWISHPYRGIYKISLSNNDATLYNEKNGLPSALNNHVYTIRNRIVVATENGLYEYDQASDAFRLSAYSNNLFAGLSLRYLKDDAEGNLWFVTGKRIGMADSSNQSLIYFPELQRKINSGFEHIYPLDRNNIFIGGDHGFYHINLSKYFETKSRPVVFIRNVTGRYKADSVLFGGFGVFNKKQGTAPIQLSSKWNALHFEFCSPFISQSENLQYSYRMKGFDEEWSLWTDKTEKDYTNIPPGNYVFEVKVRNNVLEESVTSSFEVAILNPWYKTTTLKIVYFVCSIFLLYYLFRQQATIIKRRHEKRLMDERNRYEEQQRLLSFQHQLQIERSEKTMMQLKNDKLESELASSAMNLVQKTEFLNKIKDEINKLNKSDGQKMDTGELKKILRGIADEGRLDEEWEQFSIHFNKVHNNFLLNLKNRFPELKAHELKLCAYLRMNLSSKEMARLLSISVRGVEINRYRLRKKLQMKPKEDFFDFLMNIDLDNAGR